MTDAHSSVEDLRPDFDAVLHRRRAVRAFRTDPVPEDLLTEVLDDAAQAPSWSNTRPYMLAIATGERADFDMKTNTVMLRGNVVVTQGGNVMRGDRLVVDLTSGVSRVDGTGPVKLLIPQTGSAQDNKDGKGGMGGLGGLGGMGPKFGPQKQNSAN